MLNFFKKIKFSFSEQIVFQLEVFIEMIFNGALAFPRYDDDVFYPGSNCFFDNVLDCRFVYDRQHFFGHCLCHWKKSSAKPRCWNNCLCRFLCHKLHPPLIVSESSIPISTNETE